MTASNPYIGRFAPSPSGPLHAGSLVAAMASYLHARQHQGIWLLRIEDVDETRTQTGAANDILRTLDALGFEWDGKVIYQSERKERYAEVIAQLLDSGYAYPCACSRADITSTVTRGNQGLVYPGSCRKGIPDGKSARTIRLRTNDEPVSFQDMIVGTQVQHIESEVGDFIIRRADGYTAYQLAVVVDDGDQSITHVIRGADLLSSTARQIYLQQLLGLPRLQYAHTPLVLDELGRKLSKQDQAHPVSVKAPLRTLHRAYEFLFNTAVEPDLDSVAEFWQWAWTQPATPIVSAL